MVQPDHDFFLIILLNFMLRLHWTFTLVIISLNSSRVTLSTLRMHDTVQAQVTSGRMVLVRTESIPPFTKYLIRHKPGIAARGRRFLLPHTCMTGRPGKSSFLPFGGHCARQCWELNSSNYTPMQNRNYEEQHVSCCCKNEGAGEEVRSSLAGEESRDNLGQLYKHSKSGYSVGSWLGSQLARQTN